MGLGFISIPLINGLFSIMGEIKAAYFNVTQAFHNLKSINNYEHYTQTKTELLHNKLLKFDIGEKTEMIDIIELIQIALSSKGML